MKIAIISILVFIVTIFLIVLLRTLLTRSTPAKTLELLLENGERAQEYGGKLAKNER